MTPQPFFAFTKRPDGRDMVGSSPYCILNYG